MTSSYLKPRVFVCHQPTDLRLHFEGLWGLVRSSLNKDPFEGDHFVFIAKSRKRIKVLRWDGTGLCILCKRLDKGLFFAPWQRKSEEPIVLTPSELALLLEGSEQVGRIKLSPDPWVPSIPTAA